MRRKYCAPVILAFVAFAGAFSGCSGSAGSLSTTETSAEPTGAAGLTNLEVESYFYDNVPDASFVHSSILKDGSYSLDFSLSNDKAEWENNYDEFALAVKSACNDFTKAHSAKARIFSIHFFTSDDSQIYWLSTDGGETGTLNEKIAPSYEREKKLTFDELVAYYAKK